MHEPTEQDRKKVISYARLGITHVEIARVLQIDPKTLRLHYRDELDTAHTIANAAVGGELDLKAMDGDTTCLIWWTKARMRWSEKRETDSEAPDPITSIEYVEVDASLPK